MLPTKHDQPKFGKAPEIRFRLELSHLFTPRMPHGEMVKTQCLCQAVSSVPIKKGVRSSCLFAEIKVSTYRNKLENPKKDLKLLLNWSCIRQCDNALIMNHIMWGLNPSRKIIPPLSSILEMPRPLWDVSSHEIRIPFSGVQICQGEQIKSPSIVCQRAISARKNGTC
jgi:hypothetical protein